jgi:hypothetical protein
MTPSLGRYYLAVHRTASPRRTGLTYSVRCLMKVGRSKKKREEGEGKEENQTHIHPSPCSPSLPSLKP